MHHCILCNASLYHSRIDSNKESSWKSQKGKEKMTIMDLYKEFNLDKTASIVNYIQQSHKNTLGRH